jgi:hypothetical protein
MRAHVSFRKLKFAPFGAPVLELVAVTKATIPNPCKGHAPLRESTNPQSWSREVNC